jgi:hypothetical protein
MRRKLDTEGRPASCLKFGVYTIIQAVLNYYNFNFNFIFILFFEPTTSMFGTFEIHDTSLSSNVIHRSYHSELYCHLYGVLKFNRSP